MNTSLTTIFLFSSFQAAISMVISLFFALIIAHIVYTYQFAGKHILLSLAPLFAAMPTKLCALSIELFYGVKGLIGIILAHVFMNLPYAFFLFYAGYQKIDQTLLWVAQDLGASEWKIYTTCILPMIRQTIYGAGAVIFLVCFSSFVPFMLATSDHHNTLDMLMQELYQSGNYQQLIVSLIVRLAFALPICIFIFVNPKYTISESCKPVDTKVKKSTQLGGTYNFFSYESQKKLLLIASTCVVILLLLGPFGALLIHLLKPSIILQAYEHMTSVQMFGSIGYQIVFNSLYLAAASSIGALVIACVLAICAFLAKSRVLKICITSITILPFLGGPIVIGMVCDGLGKIGMYTPWCAIIISHVVLNYPFAFRSIQTQLCTYTHEFTYLAASLGATHFKIWCTIIFPFIREAFLYAWCLSFALSLVEVGAASVIDNGVITLPLAIRLLRTNGQQDAVLSVSLVLLILIFITSLCAVKINYVL